MMHSVKRFSNVDVIVALRESGSRSACTGTAARSCAIGVEVHRHRNRSSSTARPTVPSSSKPNCIRRPESCSHIHLAAPLTPNSTALLSASSLALCDKRFKSAASPLSTKTKPGGPRSGRRHVSRAVECLRRCRNKGDGRESHERELGIHTGTTCFTALRLLGRCRSLTCEVCTTSQHAPRYNTE